MKKLLLIGSTVCTLFSTPVTALLGAEIIQHKETNAQATAARLSLQTFVERALENHPAMGKLRETWREQRNLAMKTLARNSPDGINRFDSDGSCLQRRGDIGQPIHTLDHGAA